MNKRVDEYRHKVSVYAGLIRKIYHQRIKKKEVGIMFSVVLVIRVILYHGGIRVLRDMILWAKLFQI